MHAIVLSRLAPAYQVRRLKEADVPAIFDLMCGNPLFYKYSVQTSCAQRERITEDIRALPPGTTAEQKYYVGLFDDAGLLAVLDLIDGYPEAEIAYIGFFMMRADAQGKGIGSRIIVELLAELKTLGFAAVRLGIDKGNPQSTHFWLKNGFAVLDEKPQPDGGCYLVAEKVLQEYPAAGNTDRRLAE